MRMNIVDFINSETIALHFLNNFKPEEYDDLSVRYAWLIWQSRKKSIKEKIEAWQEIIDTMPDFDLFEHGYIEEEKTLHQFLKEYIVYTQVIIDKFFMREETAKFSNRFSWYEDEFETSSDMICDQEFSFFADCIGDLWHFVEGNDEIISSHIEKNYIGGEKISLEIKCNEIRGGELDYDIIAIEECSEKINNFEELNDVFKNMWFYFPIPFKPGDIVKIDYPKSEAFVFDSIFQKEKYISHTHEHMPAYGYFTGWDGVIKYAGINNYMGLTYYRDPLPKGKKILEFISDYLKGNIALDALLAKHLVTYLNKQAKFYNDYIIN